ncbi:hypothetical protein K4G58_04100 [Helicobacter sp. Faydin-H64]|uniref:Uncharacterized protein n=2 Tax=Helicobacter turcicus TaxID=2867412 RepID=A0ABS7JMG9_9HELI|nr:hypothetical protein [Helicobacter turcicus]MBX7545507.1 hypothetical protein [Helicobacter turcicus]
MQTFSTMRRNSTDKRNLRIFFLVIFSIVYIAITDIYYFLPPLFGVVYVIAQEKYEEQSFGTFYFFVPFFLYFEASKGLPLLSTLLFILFSFKILLPKFRKFFGYSKIFIPLFIFYAYFGYFAFLYFFGWLFDTPVPQFSLLLALYAGIEVFLIWIFLWIL